MFGILIIVAIVMVLGLAFLGVEQSSRSSVRRRGPWIVAAVAWAIVLVAVSTYDDGLGSLLHPIRRDQLRDLLLAACVFGLMASEAVLVSRWLFKVIRGRAAYVLVFTCTTLFAWFSTCLAVWPFVPGS
jgi:hypothetical protein